MQRLVDETADGHERIFYRRRERNIGSKAGNIEDFIASSGGAYDYALILDADSLMEGETMVDDGAPDGRRSAARPAADACRRSSMRTAVFGRLHAVRRGLSLARLCARRGPDAGRGRPLSGATTPSCASAPSPQAAGFPKLSGQPPFGGHILSHDYVEAALLSRAGWKVEVDPDLDGSFEEGPENLIEYAKRDRRWCQGNLQHRRAARRARAEALEPLHASCRASWPISPRRSGWRCWPPASSAAMLPAAGHSVRARTRRGIWALALPVAAVLLLPKLLILLRGALRRAQPRVWRQRCARCRRCWREIVVSTCWRPIMLLLQSRAVAQVLLGLDGGWPATNRDAAG